MKKTTFFILIFFMLGVFLIPSFSSAQWTQGSGVVYTNSSNDFVGIGINNPSSRLYLYEQNELFNTLTLDNANPDTIDMIDFKIEGDQRVIFKYDDGGSGLLISTVNDVDPYDKLSIGTGATPRLTIDAQGRVGVGTEEPTEKLDVIGNLKVHGIIYTDGVVSSSTTFICNQNSSSTQDIFLNQIYQDIEFLFDAIFIGGIAYATFAFLKRWKR